jgi:choline dehydrogenase-like flavoprotein
VGPILIDHFNRANQQDYDDWELLGNPGWGWSDILPLSMKTEKFIPPDSEDQLRVLPDPPFNPEFHGRTGGVVNSFGKSWPQTIEAFQPTLEALGIPQNPDVFDGSDLNGYISLQSIDPSNSTRSYSATAYLRPNLGRKNLVVMQGAQATKVVLNGKKAVGVEFVVNGTTFEVAARKEVVLSAGAFQVCFQVLAGWQ